MIIARQKRTENIAEYLLYMWQIEDLIRAYEFDKEKITRELADQYLADPETRREIRQWYSDLVDAMKTEQITQSGHLGFLVGLAADLDDFHFRLIDSPHHPDYRDVYEKAVINISDFRLKMGVKDRIGDVEVCLTVLYGLMLMKMKKRPVSSETAEAIDSLRDLMALLSVRYRAFEEGNLEV